MPYLFHKTMCVYLKQIQLLWKSRNYFHSQPIFWQMCGTFCCSFVSLSLSLSVSVTVYDLLYLSSVLSCAATYSSSTHTYSYLQYTSIYALCIQSMCKSVRVYKSKVIIFVNINFYHKTKQITLICQSIHI